MFDNAAFFASLRASTFGGHLTQGQVDGLTALLTRWNADHAMCPDAWLAYALATAKWETDGTMQPIDEVGHGKGRPYGVPDPATGQTYYGRGYVQLTWKANYQKQSARLGLDLLSFPEMVKNPAVAAAILFNGMIAGDFTGAKLSRFFNPTVNDPVNARRIINGTDKAETIAAIHRDFAAALAAARAAPVPAHA